jgi:hypothetical protein
MMGERGNKWGERKGNEIKCGEKSVWVLVWRVN